MNKRLLAFILAAFLLLTGCSSGSSGGGLGFGSSGKKDDFDVSLFDKPENTVSNTYTFIENDASEKVSANSSALNDFKEELISQNVEYPYSEMFNFEEAIGGIKNKYTVENHEFSVLDENGKLTLEHFKKVVKGNNEKYIEEQKNGFFEPLSEEVLTRICEIIVETVEDTLNRYPDINKDRVYCNLGNLKIVEKPTSLDFGSVNAELALYVNSATAGAAVSVAQASMYNVIVHETMHIIQIGCTCEEIEGCERRCGLAYAYTDREQDYSDWTWLAEGSAERNTCLFASVEPMTYKTLVNYILSLDLATVLNDDLYANYIESVFFFNDLDMLYNAFHAKTEAQQEEVYKMVYSLEMMQANPDDVGEAYTKIYGVEYTDEVRDELHRQVKRPAVMTLTKSFYYNLATALSSGELTKNDLLFLINLYDSTINYHLEFDDAAYDSYNAEFVEWYKEVKAAFFSCLSNVTVDDYAGYVASDGESNINAGLSWLDSAKKDFLIEKFEDNFCNYKFIK